MARYNTSLTTNSLSGTATISSPLQGAFTELTGTAPYTVTLPSPNLYPGQTQTFYNATSGTITLTTPSGFFSGLGGSGTSNQTIPVNTVVSVISDGTNYVTLSEDGSVLYATDATITGNLTANGGTISIAPQSLTINPNGPGAVNNVNIGASLRGTGAFTTLAANGSTTLTANVASSSTSTGTLVVTGGVGVSGAVNAASLTASSITGTIQTAAQPNITSTGSLSVPGLTAYKSTSANDTGVALSARKSDLTGGLFITPSIGGGQYNNSHVAGDAAIVSGTQYGAISLSSHDAASVRVSQTGLRLNGRNSSNSDMLVDVNGNVIIGGSSNASAKLDIVDTASDGSWSRTTHRETASNSSFIGTYRSGAFYSTGIFTHNYALNAWADLYINAHQSNVGGVATLGGGLSNKVVIGGNVGINKLSPLTKLHVAQSDPTGTGTLPSNTTAIIDSSTNNILLFRNTADNATNAGIAMQDNNIGGYVLFHNYNTSNTAISDRMHIAGYQGVNIQYGTADSTDVTARTTVAKFDSNGFTLNSGNILDNKGYIKHTSYDWKWHARRWATGYVSDVRSNISGRFWNETAAPTDEVYLHTQDLSSTTYIGENIWGDVHSYKAWAVTCIYVKRAFTISATLNGDDPYALYINKQYVTGSDSCCAGVAYSYAFTPGWYRLEMVYSESGGGHYVQLGWNIKDYLGNIAAMTPFGPYG